MNQWVIKNLKQFQDIYIQYNRTERALSSCAMTMMKILNGLSEMSYTKFHRYEKKMFWRAIKLFSRQCIPQIYVALECQAVEKKKEYIVDLESSISEITDVYKNIMAGVSNAERQMVQSLSVDIKIHDLSPKLCAFYSSVLEKVVEMFEEVGREYAFILHPVLHSTIEAKVLLEKREQSGKVVIIYVSESIIEEFDLVSICLLHEAFHVLTKTERMRSERAKYFMLQMVDAAKNLILHDVFFENDGQEIKEKIMSYWFKDLREKMAEFEQWDKNDKRFYGQYIKLEVENTIKEYFREIEMNLENTVMDAVVQNVKCEDYMEYQKLAHDVERITDIIRSNIFYIISENLIAATAEQIMFIYRETYADIACILLLEIDPEVYQKAFLRSIPFQYDASYKDETKCLRESLVAKIVSTKISPDLQESWKDYADAVSGTRAEQEPAEISRGNIQQNPEKQLSKESFYGRIEITSILRRNYEKYLGKCANEFSARLKSIDGVQDFRKYMKKFITETPQQLLKNVLGGDVI